MAPVQPYNHLLPKGYGQGGRHRHVRPRGRPGANNRHRTDNGFGDDGVLCMKIFLITLIVSSAYELLALNTRFNIFGCRYQYNYDFFLFKKTFFKLPIIIPVLYAISHVFIPSYFGYIWLDLLFDPQAIRMGYWKFARKGLWFGVPLTNYMGWSIIWLTVWGVLWLLH